MVQLVYQIGVLLVIYSPIWGTTFFWVLITRWLMWHQFVIHIRMCDLWSTQLIFQIRFIVSTQFGDEIRMDDRAWIPNLGKAYNTAAEYIYILETTPPFYNAVTKRKRTLIQSDVVLSFTMSCSGLSFCASCTGVLTLGRTSPSSGVFNDNDDTNPIPHRWQFLELR